MKKATIKAIRLVCGYNSDLRHKLPYRPGCMTIYEQTIFNFLHDNMCSIFSADTLYQIMPHGNDPGTVAGDKVRLYRFLHEQTRAVCLGIYDDTKAGEK